MGNWPRGPPCFQLARGPVVNEPTGSPLLCGHCPKCIRYSVSTAEKGSNTLLAFPKELPKPLRYCSKGLQGFVDTFHIMSHHRFGHFLYISIEAVGFSLLRGKKIKATENLKLSAVLLLIMIYSTIPFTDELKLVRQSL